MLDLYRPDRWRRPDGGPLYEQFAAHLAAAMARGEIAEGARLPAERDLAAAAGISRVTLRKAMALLAARDLAVLRRGAGNFLRAAPAPRVELSLSALTSFTENMEARGRAVSSRLLSQGVVAPEPEESLALGVAAPDKVSRIERLRSADGLALAIETTALPCDILPDPSLVETSVYATLRARGLAPARAMQRITALNLPAREAGLLGLAVGAAALRIDRTGYLPSGRPVEFTRGLYRPDHYDFITELRRDPG